MSHALPLPTIAKNCAHLFNIAETEMPIALSRNNPLKRLPIDLVS